MEFLGDSVLQFVVSVYLFKHFPEHHEGHLTVGLEQRGTLGLLFTKTLQLNMPRCRSAKSRENVSDHTIMVKNLKLNLT